VIGPLLEQAVTQARTTPTAEELAAAASHTAYLLGVLRQAGEQLGAPPPHQVLVDLQGLRLWSLQIRDLDGPSDARCGPNRRPANCVEGRHGVERSLAGYWVGGEVAALLLRRRPPPTSRHIAPVGDRQAVDHRSLTTLAVVPAAPAAKPA
jgi:hypothetical protein